MADPTPAYQWEGAVFLDDCGFDDVYEWLEYLCHDLDADDLAHLKTLPRDTPHFVAHKAKTTTLREGFSTHAGAKKYLENAADELCEMVYEAPTDEPRFVGMVVGALEVALKGALATLPEDIYWYEGLQDEVFWTVGYILNQIEEDETLN